MKAVVDHADGTRETFVSDGRGRSARPTSTRRHGHDPQRRLRRHAPSATTRAPRSRLGHGGFDDAGLAARVRDRPAPAAAEPDPRDVQPPRPGARRLEYETVKPKSLITLADGSVVADFGKVISAMPRIEFSNGVAGRQVMQTSFRLNNTTLSAAVAAGATNIKVAARRELRGRRQDHRRPGRERLRRGRSRGPHDHRGRHRRRDRHRHHARRAAQPRARQRALRRGLARGHLDPRHAGLRTRWWYTQKDGAADRPAAPVLGLALPADPAARRGRGRSPPTTSPPSCSTRPRPADRRATFDSDNPTLNAVFDLMQHSAIHSSEETFLDTPTREKGQFTGDTVDISYATMIAAGDRAATSARSARSSTPARTRGRPPSSGYCTAAQLPCSYPSIGTPGPRQRRLPQRRQHARHPGLHGVRAGMGLALLRAERRRVGAQLQL